MLFNKKQVAEILNVSGKTISRLIDKGEFPFIRIGRRKYVSKQVVLDWIKAQTRYNSRCVGSVQSHTGESLCDSINVTASTTLPTNQEVENRLGALLKPLQRE